MGEILLLYNVKDEFKRCGVRGQDTVKETR